MLIYVVVSSFLQCSILKNVLSTTKQGAVMIEKWKGIFVLRPTHSSNDVTINDINRNTLYNQVMESYS